MSSPDPIVAIEPIVLRIPFEDGGSGRGLMPTRWNGLDIMLLRVETQSGLVGWGEGFGYLCQHATARASLRLSITMTAPGGQSSTALRWGWARSRNTLRGFRSSRAGM